MRVTNKTFIIAHKFGAVILCLPEAVLSVALQTITLEEFIKSGTSQRWKKPTCITSAVLEYLIYSGTRKVLLNIERPDCLQMQKTLQSFKMTVEKSSVGLLPHQGTSKQLGMQAGATVVRRK